MKALIIHGKVHTLFADHELTPEQEAALPTWNNANPAPDALVSVPSAWEPYIDTNFSWTPELGLVEPCQDYVVDLMKMEKLAEFDAVLTRLDTLKIRPASSIAVAQAVGDPVSSSDTYRLDELEAASEEHRDLRRQVLNAATPEEIIVVSPWWPK